MNIYGEVPPSQIAAEKKYFLSAIFKLVPYKENGYEFLDNYFESLLQRLLGFNKISGFQSEVVTIMSLLAYAREEDDFEKYRKAVFDACGLVQFIKESDIHA